MNPCADYEQALEIRDKVLDEWLKVCSDEQRKQTQMYLMYGVYQSEMPVKLIRAQENLLKELELC